MSAFNKVFVKVMPVLIQTAVVVMISTLIMSDYIDKRVVKVKEYVDTKALDVRAVSLSDIIQKSIEGNESSEEIEAYTEDLLNYYSAQGILVIDANNILAGPDRVFQKIPNSQKLKALMNVKATPE